MFPHFLSIRKKSLQKSDKNHIKFYILISLLRLKRKNKIFVVIINNKTHNDQRNLKILPTNLIIRLMYQFFVSGY